MRRTLLALSSLLPLLAVAGCGSAAENPAPVPAASASGQSPAGDAPSEAPTAPTHDSGLPVDAMPVIPGGRESRTDCPYLDTQWVADTNGQRVTGVGVDERFDTPACVYWSYPEEPQLTVIVRHTDSVDAATAVVDWAAPIASTDPAEEPEGWSGGRFGGNGHALYAVQKDRTAVVVFSNQEQSIKPQLVAERVIGQLGLG
ncbi:DUF2020 domain-containing protein [Corynebacterium sp. CCM 8835]|uniref:DUF2020 domain-containing protein n=1 Tax=Corynebacterium antarcticum TaxID=2800405 RepID=A0A9Q4GL86_9CORY|nr:DUF2020 domain-containing protein [Corynebacterium antarcticum]MCK7643161.1 DUF2020 domain-containing protein [Corynebacterium antarcticum]MCK7661664.1 DUF2020 domain-containing protein [Corynebacterium antarcticum]MCL0246677.1 DUF2020 domain-containing protein [Corynebacterium antarcticum]MCX7492818.1 DUF2020 domain-containing protein [Corynebacterium antarcticum]MCX7538687.1 DUF2020 domain-containing protein [Corynebacterium antarcticum]